MLRFLVALAFVGFFGFIGLAIWFQFADLAAYSHGVPALIAQGEALRDDTWNILPLVVVAAAVSGWLAATGLGEG